MGESEGKVEEERGGERQGERIYRPSRGVTYVMPARISFTTGMVTWPHLYARRLGTTAQHCGPERGEQRSW